MTKNAACDSAHYTLRCLECGESYQDTDEGFLLNCQENHKASLLRADYLSKKLYIRDEEPGIFRYRDWLPVRRNYSGVARTIVYQSDALSKWLGLENLYLAFNGYWPEKGACMETCSFKELEALSVTSRISPQERGIMVVSSAGNTGMAFLQICSQVDIPLLVVVPAEVLSSLWITCDKPPSVMLATLEGDVDYLDAIELADAIALHDGFYPEGGAKNIARRDGMGTVVLSAVETMGKIPDHYFQAVGSGTGGIAAWEMATRLRESGEYGDNIMRLHLVQNKPFTVMTDAWQAESPDLIPVEESIAREQVKGVYAKVLSNRKPPYAMRGGVYDALYDTGGKTYAIDNATAEQAGRRFEELEGCDLHPAAAVALAGLCQAVENGSIGKNESVLFNITGGGAKRIAAEDKKVMLEPDIIFNKNDLSEATIMHKLDDLLKVMSS